MREFDYELIKKMVFKYLWKQHHERHLEDCIQFCALEFFEGRTNIQWTVIDYCRQNGIGERGKVAARTLENATFVGLATSDDGEVNENSYLFDHHAQEEFNRNQQLQDEGKDCLNNFVGRLEEFLLPINLNKETFSWAKKIYLKRWIKEGTFNI